VGVWACGRVAWRRKGVWAPPVAATVPSHPWYGGTYRENKAQNIPCRKTQSPSVPDPAFAISNARRFSTCSSPLDKTTANPPVSEPNPLAQDSLVRIDT